MHSREDAFAAMVKTLKSLKKPMDIWGRVRADDRADGFVDNTTHQGAIEQALSLARLAPAPKKTK